MTKKKEKILVLTSSFPAKRNSFRGGGNFVYDLAAFLTKDYSIIVLTPLLNNTLKKEKFDEINIYRFGFLPFKSLYKYFSNGILSAFKENSFLKLLLPLFLICQFFALKKVLKKEKDIKLIHAHWFIPQGLISVIYKILLNNSIKLIVTSHGSDINTLKNVIFRYIQRFIINNANIVTAVSNDLKSKLQSINSKNDIPVIPMGINTSLFRPTFDQNIRKEYNIQGAFLLFVGRLETVKGIDLLIEALPTVIKSYPETKVLIIGTGLLEMKLKRRCKELNISRNVSFLGRIQSTNLPSFYSTADLVIMPSISEGSPVVLPEALCCNAFVLTSDIPVYKEYVEEGKNGLTFKSMDISDLSIKINDILNNQHKKRSVDNKLIAKHFDWKNIASNYNSLYSKLLQNS